MLGKLIKLYRISIGLRQSELADQIGVSQNYMSLVESGKREIGHKKLALIINNYPEFGQLLLNNRLSLSDEEIALLILSGEFVRK